MYRVPLKKVIYPILILTALIGIGVWLFNMKNIENKVPSKGVFVYSKEFDLA